jgi:hypothetical protein
VPRRPRAAADENTKAPGILPGARSSRRMDPGARRSAPADPAPSPARTTLPVPPPSRDVTGSVLWQVFWLGDHPRESAFPRLAPQWYRALPRPPSQRRGRPGLAPGSLFTRPRGGATRPLFRAGQYSTIAAAVKAGRRALVRRSTTAVTENLPRKSLSESLVSSRVFGFGAHWPSWWTRRAGIRLPAGGDTARPRRLMGSASTRAGVARPQGRSTRSTAATRASSSTPTSRTSTRPFTRRSSASPCAMPPTCWTGSSTMRQTSRSRSTTPTPRASRTTYSP